MGMTRRLAAAAIALACSLGPASAETWPARPVRIIVPFAAGSTPDAVTRVLADRLQARLGQPFIVENKPGASGNLGTDAVAKAEPDGYTLGVSIVGPLVLNQFLFPRLPYDPARDLVPVTLTASQPSVLVVSNGLGVSSVAELLAKLKGDSGKLNFGSIGLGSLSHLAVEALAAKAGGTVVHVPYQGSPAVVTALTRGDVQLAVMPAGAVVPQARAGAFKMLAVTSPEPSRLLPDLPTLRSAGVDGVEADAWNGLVAPAKTPEAVTSAIRREVAAAFDAPEIREKLAAQYMEPIPSSRERFEAVIAGERARWEPLIRARNIRVGQ
ncbi:MAG: tripartite tricarboxylate transporter substrate binding protein [Methylobacteriaceae bacterium]|nr:tripartite tricarboxylate transporter substrate binding protein [Methylobacteriaceae bacterium]